MPAGYLLRTLSTKAAIASIESKFAGVISSSLIFIWNSVSRNTITSRIPVESITPWPISEASLLIALASLVNRKLLRIKSLIHCCSPMRAPDVDVNQIAIIT